MDWSKAKNVLIYAFMLLNLVLGYQLWSDLREQADESPDLTSLAGNVQRAMETKDIKVAAAIPTDTPELPKISYRFVGTDGGKPMNLEEPVYSKLIFSPEELVSALEGSIPDIANYRYDPVDDEEGTFVMHPLVGGKYPLFRLNLELQYSNQRIISYTEQQIEISSVGEEKRQRVLSASKALGNLVENYLPNDSVVKSIELGYYGELFNSDAQVAAPAWRFALESGEVFYVQGISGDVISASSDKTKE
ncbi:two-component system regulatory protein YycI [Paenibacillus pinistramenti]|uniref:two-component system regulatory protein YycI n=1 Tax=Paenibacillus pinistramenti TaxID=1768003 RepID=UPI001108DBEF|nr:two-component system regulatory protein YycI [Paenibacillus pinistramenti]